MKKPPDKDLAYQTGIFRYGVIADLLARPRSRGELADALRAIATKEHVQPWNGETTTVTTRTLERWLACARGAERPAEVLQPKIRSDLGTTRVVEQKHRDFLAEYRRAEPSWSVQLLFDNLRAQFDEGGPSYSSILRYMRTAGLLVDAPGRRRKHPRREVRSFEVGFVGELWHMDFHKGSRHVADEKGEWVQPLCVAFIDDHSRLVCHAQWYLNETAEVLAHAFIQAVLKRGLPRGFYTDCGSAMRAGEFVAGLENLSVIQKRTMTYSPWQNGRQEAFWQPLEGRLMKMVPKGNALTLELLNRLTQAWVEQEYQVAKHTETGVAPMTRFLGGTSVLREAPAYDDLRRAFRIPVTRSQRQTDGTVTLDGIRFEIPTPYRHLESLTLRYARWDLSEAEILCPQTRKSISIIKPLNKLANASGIRREIEPTLHDDTPSPPCAKEGDGSMDQNLPPLLARLLREHEETFPLPGYMPLSASKGQP
jgi:putative transposase